MPLRRLMPQQNRRTNHMFRLRLLFIVLSLNSTFCLCASPQPQSIQMSLCQIGARQYGKSLELVEVKADLYNGMPHGLFLGNESCPKQRIQIDYEKRNADESLLGFDKFISQNVGNIGLIGNGRFLGMLKQNRATGRSFFFASEGHGSQTQRPIGRWHKC
jgi:hypothetical protein